MDLWFKKLNSTKLLPYFHGILVLETQDEVLCGQEGETENAVAFCVFFVEVSFTSKVIAVFCLASWHCTPLSSVHCGRIGLCSNFYSFV